MSTLEIIPVSLRQANAYVALWHRHHRPVRGALFALGCMDDGQQIRGVAIVGRPVARHNQDGRTAEVTRVATDGSPNACSLLYGACWRAARALGYLRLMTYILATEPGTSVRAAGWRRAGESGGGEWSRPSRPRRAASAPGAKQRWEAARGERRWVQQAGVPPPPPPGSDMRDPYLCSPDGEEQERG